MYSCDHPDLAWIRSELRNNLSARYRGPILDAFIVGSEARGNAHAGSDLDIAVVIPKRRRFTSLQFSERWHALQTWPIRWNGRTVDVQFFYADDPELETYAKIEVSKDRKRVRRTTASEETAETKRPGPSEPRIR